MYCAICKQFACQCLPQRLKPQTAACVAVFPFFPILFFQIFRNIQAVSYSIYLQSPSDPILYRAKNRIFLGLLALFFYPYLRNNRERGELL